MARWRLALLAAVAAALPACASSDDRDWMKVNERYTVDEFRRDYAACSKSGKLDDGCMRSRGWVDVSRKDKAAAPSSREERLLGAPSNPSSR